MRIVFFGTPVFAAQILQTLLDHDGISAVAVVTKPDKPKGRSAALQSSAVKILAQKQSIPLYQPERCSTPAFAEVLKQCAADLFVVVAYGEILKQEILDIPRLGCINVHASLLPKYRGAAPIHRAVMAGESETGVSIMYMVRAMDAGDILAQKSLPIAPDATTGQLERQLSLLGAEALIEVLDKMKEGPVHGAAQDHQQATFAPKIELEEAHINWQASAEQVHNLVRAANPFPGAWCLFESKGQQKRLKILRTEVVASASGKPGSVLDEKRGLVVACAEGSVRLLEVKPEGKAAMSAEAFLRGAQEKPQRFF